MNSVQLNITSTATPRESSRVAQWAQENPAAFAWVIDNADTNSFAGSLMASLYKWGQLTPKQLTAVMGAIARAKIMQDKRDNAPVVSLEPVEDAFKRASGAGVNRPKLRLGEFVFSPAPATGKNPGAIYIKHGNGEYLGKVLGGKLFTVAAVSTALEQDIVAVAADPLNAAIAYGKKYGKCSVCGRTLTDEDSVGRGIGPVCAANYGWGV